MFTIKWDFLIKLHDHEHCLEEHNLMCTEVHRGLPLLQCKKVEAEDDCQDLQFILFMQPAA